jgi:phosphatidylglycerophosphatase A
MNSVARFIYYACASGVWSGYSPFAPGTVGSIVALVILFFSPSYIQLLSSSCICFVIGWYCTFRIEREEKLHDPSFIVIDEIAGMWLALATPIVPHTWVWVLFALALFRLFDIRKPFPVSYFDQKKSAFSVMADDIVAALYASLCLHVLYAGYQSFGILTTLSSLK